MLAALLGQMPSAWHRQVLKDHFKHMMDKQMEATIVSWGYIEIMEMKMRATIFYWDHMSAFTTP